MSDWISVDERLPDWGRLVLTWKSGQEMRGQTEILMIHDGVWSVRNQSRIYAIDAVTHWMPLPDPPKPWWDPKTLELFEVVS